MDEMNEMTMNEVTMDETVEVIPEEAVEVINDEKLDLTPALVLISVGGVIGGFATAGVKKLYDKHKSAKVEKPKTKKKISFRLPVVITEEAVPEEVTIEEMADQIMEEIKKESEENK